MRYPYEPSLDYYDGRQNVLPDLRFSENQQNRGFAMPGGFNSNNAIVNTLASMVFSNVAGVPMEGIGPLQGYSGTDTAFLNASQRQSEDRKARAGLISSAPGLRRFGSETSSNSLFQEAYNMSGAGGGNMEQAYQTAVNRFSSSTRLGYGIRDQSKVAEYMVRGISDAYTVRDDNKNPSNNYEGNPLYYSKEKSFGFDVKDSLRNLDAMRRSGAIGFSDKEIREATAPGLNGKLADPQKLEQLSKESNRFMKIAKQTFGEDLDPSQLIDLMDKATDGLSKISGSKASEFASKVQATAAALDISGRAFGEYMAMQQNAMKSVGITGGSSTTAIMNAAIGAKSLQEAAQKNGNTEFSDINKAMDASMRIAKDYAGSEDFQTSRAAIRVIGGMSESDRRSKMINGRSLNEVAQEAHRAGLAGDTKEVERINQELMEYLGPDKIYDAKFMDEKVGARNEARLGINTAKQLTAGAGAKGTLNDFIEFSTSQDRAELEAGVPDGGKMTKLLGENGLKLRDVISGLDTDQIQNSKKIEGKLASMGVTDEKKRSEIASAVSQRMTASFERSEQTMTESQIVTARAQLTKALLNQFPQDAKDEEQRDKEGIKTQILASVMGGMSSSKLTPGNALDSAGNVETEAKAIAKARAKSSGGSDEVNQDDRVAAIKKVAGDTIDAPKLKRLIEAVTPDKDGNSKISKLAETVYNVRNKAQKAGEDPEDVDAKVDAAIESESKNLGLDLSKEDYEAIKKKSEKPEETKPGETKPGDVPAGSGSANAAPIIDVKMLTAALQDSIGKAVIAKLDDVLKKIPEKITVIQASPSKGQFSIG